MSNIDRARTIIESVQGSLGFMPLKYRRDTAMNWLAREDIPPNPAIIKLLVGMSRRRK